MGKRCCRGRVSQVISRNIDRLHRGDRTLLGRRNPFLQFSHLRRQVGLVTNRRRHPSKQRRNFRTSLGEAEDIINKKEHILALFITKIFRHSQCRKTNPKTGSRRLIHLTKNQSGFFEDTGIFHLVPEIITFTGSFTNPAEDREATVLSCNIINKFHDNNSFTNSGSAEKADLSTFNIGCQHINNLDSGLQRCEFGTLLFVCRCGTMNRVAFFLTNRPHLIDRVADNINDTT